MPLDSLLDAAIGRRNGRQQDYDSVIADNGDEEEVDNGNLKFVFVGGKGGVGKTTSSSAIATLFATYCHKRVLLISTDPAHSLSDAFRCSFSNIPTSPPALSNAEELEKANAGLEGAETMEEEEPLSNNDEMTGTLHVMEVDPRATMEAELSKWALLAEDVMGAGDDQDGSIVSKIRSFQEWLSGIPGIDEATALSSAIKHIESGEYDIIVFDTAPTGHTLKLLAMPDILQAGIEKLQSWQSTMWGLWEGMKSLTPGAMGLSSKRKVNAKDEVAFKLEEYKRGIQKVAFMLQDQKRTRFVVVCIAEFLSVSETQRLLQELAKNNVRASHIIVNQLVINDALSCSELQELEFMAENGGLHLNQTLLQKTVHACRLTTARKGIQERYLEVLRSFPEAQIIRDGICEVPLLPEEVTGKDALRNFGCLMISKAQKTAAHKRAAPKPLIQPLYDDMIDKRKKDKNSIEQDVGGRYLLKKGDVVSICGLQKSSQYNGLEGCVISSRDPQTGRYGIQIKYDNCKKTLALLEKNVTFSKSKRHKGPSDATLSSASSSTYATDNANNVPKVEEAHVNKAKKVLEDPEIQELISRNPKFGEAVEDVMNNPMNFMKYLGDPEMSPFLTKAMEKFGK